MQSPHCSVQDIAAACRVLLLVSSSALCTVQRASPLQSYYVQCMGLILPSPSMYSIEVFTFMILLCTVQRSSPSQLYYVQYRGLHLPVLLCTVHGSYTPKSCYVQYRGLQSTFMIPLCTVQRSSPSQLYYVQYRDLHQPISTMYSTWVLYCQVLLCTV